MRYRAGRIIGLAVSAAAMTTAVGITAAQATRTVRITSHISVKSTGLTFRGRVTASAAPCVAARKVTLYRTNGNVLGSTITGASGRWKITASGSAGITLGRFYAKVKQRADGTAGTIYVCKGAISPTIRYQR